MPKHVCVVTSTRADYGIFKPLIRALDADDDCELRLVVTGMHLCPEFGFTVGEIERDSIPIHKKIDIQISSDLPAGMSKTMGLALIGFADFFFEYTPDLLVLLGDRYEIAAIACAAANQRIPIAHIHGGELTEGAVDNGYRHAITKLSQLHFTSCEEYRQRVIQMGEQPGMVFNVGAMGVENVLTSTPMPLDEISRRLGRDLRGQTYAVVTYHPVTLDGADPADPLVELTKAMDRFPELVFVVTKSNSDAGGRRINALWEQYCVGRDNCMLADSLGEVLYISVLRHAALILGNSSSGILEGPALRIPVVNVGDRQAGRIMTANVLHCGPLANEIEDTIRTALSPEFKQQSLLAVNPYGDGRTSQKILAIIKEQLGRGIALKKKFTDLRLEN